MRLTEAMIRDKAYELWEANGRPRGTAEAHWFAAETLLLKAIGLAPGRTDAKEKPIPPIGLRQLSNP